MLFALIVGALVTLVSGRHDGLGGTLLSTAGAVKLFPLALLVPLLAQRRWRALGAGIVVLLASSLLGIVLGGGLSVNLQWLTTVLPGIVGGFASPNNQSALAALVRLGSPVDVEPLMILGAPARLTVLPLVDAPALLRGIGIACCACLVLQHWLFCSNTGDAVETQHICHS
ncbi:DUF2029 domain-containing protein, partial [Candidatus Gracilibacteria bacterium]|nr:DUF2029 domain-containing protein [Candidatus Gracilibacteria bacterium]